MTNFNGAHIILDNGVYRLQQPDHIENLSTFSFDSVDQPSFVSQLARRAYIAAVFRPDLAFGFAVCFQYINLDIAAVKRLNNFIDMAKVDNQLGLFFVKLDCRTVSLEVFANANLANNPDLTSHLGFILCIVD